MSGVRQGELVGHAFYNTLVVGSSSTSSTTHSGSVVTDDGGPAAILHSRCCRAKWVPALMEKPAVGPPSLTVSVRWHPTGLVALTVWRAVVWLAKGCAVPVQPIGGDDRNRDYKEKRQRFQGVSWRPYCVGRDVGSGSPEDKNRDADIRAKEEPVEAVGREMVHPIIPIWTKVANRCSKQ